MSAEAAALVLIVVALAAHEGRIPVSTANRDGVQRGEAAWAFEKRAPRSAADAQAALKAGQRVGTG